MKQIEKDYEYLETSPEAAAAGFRRITRPKSLDKRLGRIAIDIDSDIVDQIKEDLLADERFLERLKTKLAA